MTGYWVLDRLNRLLDLIVSLQHSRDDQERRISELEAAREADEDWNRQQMEHQS